MRIDLGAAWAAVQAASEIGATRYPLWRSGARESGAMMDMVDLVVIVCALTNPGACQERHLLFQSSGSLRACMVQAEPWLAQWAGEHPSLRIAKWHCAWPGSEPQKS
jgi:hypothetical protein